MASCHCGKARAGSRTGMPEAVHTAAVYSFAAVLAAARMPAPVLVEMVGGRMPAGHMPAAVVRMQAAHMPVAVVRMQVAYTPAAVPTVVAVRMPVAYTPTPAEAEVPAVLVAVRTQVACMQAPVPAMVAVVRIPAAYTPALPPSEAAGTAKAPVFRSSYRISRLR